MRVTIVPEDHYIAVDSRGLNFDFPADANIHAIQWDGDHGTVEQKVGGSRPATLSEVQPFVDLWEAERARVDAPPPVIPPTPEQLREQAKRARAAAVSAITVTTQSGKTFDGDETSQDRMARAILALQLTGTPSTLWVLANNTPVQVTVAELGEALALSGAAQSAIWVIP